MAVTSLVVVLIQVGVAVFLFRFARGMLGEAQAGIRPSNRIRSQRLIAVSAVMSVMALGLGLREGEWSVPLFIVVVNALWTAWWLWKFRS